MARAFSKDQRYLGALWELESQTSSLLFIHLFTSQTFSSASQRPALFPLSSAWNIGGTRKVTGQRTPEVVELGWMGSRDRKMPSGSHPSDPQ